MTINCKYEICFSEGARYAFSFSIILHPAAGIAGAPWSLVETRRIAIEAGLKKMDASLFAGGPRHGKEVIGFTGPQSMTTSEICGSLRNLALDGLVERGLLGNYARVELVSKSGSGKARKIKVTWQGCNGSGAGASQFFVPEQWVLNRGRGQNFVSIEHLSQKLVAARLSTVARWPLDDDRARLAEKILTVEGDFDLDALEYRRRNWDVLMNAELAEKARLKQEKMREMLDSFKKPKASSSTEADQ